MIRDEAHFRGLAERFTAAALGGSWEHALDGLADATASPSAQLIGVGSEAAVPFNWITNLDPEALVEWFEMNGADPAVNPRVRAGLTSAELKVMSDEEFATEEELNSPVYQLYTRYGINRSCQTTLLRQAGFVVGMAALRGDRQGPLSTEDRRAFKLLGAHARAAIGLQLALEEQAPALIAGAFESLSVAAFICDRDGVVRSLTPAAEALVAAQQHLALSDGRLRALHRQDQRRLAEAIAEAGARWPNTPMGQEFAVRPPGGGPTLLLQVAPLPKRDHAFRFHAATLVVARSAPALTGRGPRLQAQYGLTPAESEIALAIARGLTLADIAGKREVSVGTLRSQLKSIFGKVGVNRQAELAARLNEL